MKNKICYRPSIENQDWLDKEKELSKKSYNQLIDGIVTAYREQGEMIKELTKQTKLLQTLIKEHRDTQDQTFITNNVLNYILLTERYTREYAPNELHHLAMKQITHQIKATRYQEITQKNESLMFDRREKKKVSDSYDNNS